jgi:phosphatidylethanolamine-binding protein (PEBP) family uncharacterized protein
MRIRHSTSITFRNLTLLTFVSGCDVQEASPSVADDAGLRTDSAVAVGSDASSTCVGGADVSAGSGAIPATFETVKLVLGGGGAIMPCSAAPCHGVNGAAPPDHPLELPSMSDQQLYANLTSYVSKACNGTKLVEPCRPERSALVTILKGPCGQTPRMPYGCSPETGDCIPDEYVAAVRQWIARGAPGPSNPGGASAEAGAPTRTDAGGAVASDAGRLSDASAGMGETGAGGDGGSGNATFALTSPNHADGAKFAAKYTCAEKGFMGSVQPKLQWTPGPAETKSYAITFIDRTLADKGMANGYHWVIYDIPASTMELPEGLTMPSTVMARAISGAGSGGAYLGPCPNFAGGSNTDSYEFTLYALASANTSISGTGTTGVRNAEMVLELKNLGKTKLKGTSDAKPPM